MTKLRKPSRQPRDARKPYRTPKLTRHGDLRHIALAKSGGNYDGGSKPRTRTSGWPA